MNTQDKRAWREHSLKTEIPWFEKMREQVIISPINPLAEVFQTGDGIYSIFNRCPDGSADSWSHLVLGKEKALLIDTGFGIGDLKGLVEMLSEDRELVVVNTHCHGDHTLGNYQFPNVWIHEMDRLSLEHQMTPGFWKEFCIGNHQDRIKDFFTEADVIPFQTYEIDSFSDGHIFDLGDRKVETIWTPGHSAGSCVFLDHPTGILFSSDTITSIHASMGEIEDYQPYPEMITLSAYVNGLQRINDRISEINSLYPSHGQLMVSKQIIPDMIQAVQAVIKDSNDCDYLLEHNGKPEKKKIVGLAVLTYNNQRF